MKYEIGNLDIRNKKILLELEKDCRQSNKVIAKKIGVNGDLVRYRINNLLNGGIISNFLTFVNFSKLGYTDYGLFISTYRLSKADEEEFIDFVSKNQFVSYFAKTGGKYDFIIGFLAKDVLHFNDLLLDLLKRFGEKITTRDVAIRVSLFHFSRDYLIETKTQQDKMPKFGGAMVVEDIDELDKNILKALSVDARLNVVELSSKLGKPTSTILFRIKKLKERGIIEGFYALIDPSGFNFQSHNLLVSFNNLTPAVEGDFYSFCKLNPNIVWIIKTVGKWDYEVGVETSNQIELQRVVSELKEHFSNSMSGVEFINLFKTMKYNLFPFS